MQVAAKFTHRPERHQASEKAPISLKIKLWPHGVARLQSISESRPRRLMSLVLPLAMVALTTVILYL